MFCNYHTYIKFGRQVKKYKKLEFYLTADAVLSGVEGLTLINGVFYSLRRALRTTKEKINFC